MIKRMLDFINKNPTYETLYGFDYHWPASLNVPFLQTQTSYLEHFARDKKKKDFIQLIQLTILNLILIEIELYPTEYLQKE